MELPLLRLHGARGSGLEVPGSTMQGETFESDLVRLLTSVIRVGGDLGLDSVSEMLTSHPRQAQRRLTAEGTTYRRVVDRARHLRSCELIRHSEIPLTQIALDVGYSDVANSTRAFRRWEGMPPSALRSRSS